MCNRTRPDGIRFALKNAAGALLFALTAGLFVCAPVQATVYVAPFWAADKISPEIEQFTVNHGDTITDRHEVTFQLQAQDNITAATGLQIRFSNDADVWSEWAPFRPAGEWQLSGGDGTRFLYVEVRDEAGNSARDAASIVVYVPVAGIILAPETLLLIAGGTPATLTAGVIPGSASHRQVKWHSSNKAVAQVDEGTVTPQAPGSAVITATTADGGYSASCTVEVRSAAAPLEMAGPDLCGDLNGNGTVDVSDAILLLRYITGLVTLTPEQQRLADVNGDGEINVADAVLILRYIVGLVGELPVEPGSPDDDEPPPDEDEPPPDEEEPPPGEEEPPLPPPSIVAPNSKLLYATYRVWTLATVTCSSLNVRRGPGDDYESIGALSRGESKFVREIAHTDDSRYPVWYRIAFGSQPGWICANFVDVEDVLYGLDHASYEYRLAPAPAGLIPGDYKIDAQYNFYRLEGGSRVPTGINFYFLAHNPYATLPLERPAPDFVTADYLAAEVRRIRADSPFVNIAGGFMEAQRAWGLNAIYLVAHAAHESAWGTSKIARDKNNILGFMAYDSSPYLSAATFRSMEECALYVGGYIRKAYLSEGGAYFYGRHLVSMNEKYATDPMWAIKIARTMQSITSFSGYTPVEKQLQRGTTTAALKLRSGAGTECPEILTMPQDAALQIAGMTAAGDTNWFKAIYQGESGWCSCRYVALQTRPRGAIFYSGWYNTDPPDRVNVRREPNTGAAIVGRLYFADEFTVNSIEMVLDDSGKWYPWYCIESGSLSGWVRGDLAVIDW